MKKILAVIVALILLVSFCSCNYKFVDTKWDFNKAYVTYGDKTVEYDITSWTEDETTFTITCKDGTIICSSQVNIVLVKE